MSKGLEIINFYENSNYLNTFHPNFMKDLQIVKKELQRLEAIENSEPSKENIDTATKILLTELEMISDCAEAMKEAPSSNWIEYAKTEAELDLKLYFAYLDVQQALIKAQEQEKVLEIIMKKVFPLNNHTMIINHHKEYRSYYSAFNQFYEDNYDAENYLLSQDEFELLKRYLGND